MVCSQLLLLLQPQTHTCTATKHTLPMLDKGRQITNFHPDAIHTYTTFFSLRIGWTCVFASNVRTMLRQAGGPASMHGRR